MESPSSYQPYLVALMLGLLLAVLRRRRRLNSPPGPRPWPVIGNLNLIGPKPHRSLHQLSREYGPIMQLRWGSQRVVVASSAGMAEQFLRTHDLAFASRPRTTAATYTVYNQTDIAWSPYGPYWRMARKVCLVELFSTKRLDSSQHIRAEEIRLMVRDLYTAAGRAVALKDHLFMLTLNIITRLVMGRAYTRKSAEATVVSPEEFKEMIDEILLLNGALNIGDLFPWLNFLDLQGYIGRMKAVSKQFDRFFEYVLEEHEGRRRRMGAEFSPQDMVDLLLQIADDPQLEVKLPRVGVKAFMLDMFAAGTETTSTTVDWAISELLRRPECFQKAAEELDRVVGRERWVDEEDLQRLPYMRAVVKETLRLHPPVPLLVPHYNQEDCSVAGYDIPARTQVLVNAWSIGRDPAAWGDDGVDEFRPERFQEKPVELKGKDFELLPFGAGRRMCPGYLLGMKMVEAALANLVHGFQWRLPEGMPAEELSMEERFGLTTPRKVALEVVVEPRLTPHLYLVDL